MDVYNRASHSFILIVLITSIPDVQPDCPNNNVLNFTAIAPGQYDRKWSQIGTDGARPLGYDQSVWIYNSPESMNPCAHISGTSGRRVEIMVETTARLCVRTATSPDICFDSEKWLCLPASSDDFYVEFFCDSQCAEGDVSFWYRLVKGVTPAEDPEDHWCDGRNTSDFPSSLLLLPPGFHIPPESTKAPGGASTLVLSWMLCAVLGVLFGANVLSWF